MKMTIVKLFASLSSALLFLGSAHASLMDESVRYKNNRTSYYWAGVGFSTSGLGFGGDYERLIEDDLSWGGFARFYSDGSAFVVGGNLKMHFPHYSWDFYFAPGLAVGGGSQSNVSYSGLATTTAIGGMLAINRSMTVGVESRLLNFVSGDIKPSIMDWMVMARFSF